MQWNQHRERLKGRKQDSLSHFWQGNEWVVELKNEEEESRAGILLMAPGDEGVVLNGGRRGAAWGPKALVHVLGLGRWPLTDFSGKNLCAPHPPRIVNLLEGFGTDTKNSSELFQNQMDQELKALKHILGAVRRYSATHNSKVLLPQGGIFHLGGGHDHVCPYLQGIVESYRPKRLLIVNVDPHTDTRREVVDHSGTPFRRFARWMGDRQEKEGRVETSWHLVQLGICLSANRCDHWEGDGLEEHMSILTIDEIQEQTCYFRKGWTSLLERFFSTLKFLRSWEMEETLCVLSIDCDFFSASLMEGVSAVSSMDVPIGYAYELVDFLGEMFCRSHLFWGIYEYNPVYDNLSQKGARALAGLIRHMMKCSYR